jgi:DNA-binding XRE family transcriptional regulator
MFRNLEAEMARKGLKKKHLADFLKVRYATILDKLNGKYAFSYNEALAIKKHFFPDFNLEELFETDEEAEEGGQKVNA